MEPLPLVCLAGAAACLAGCYPPPERLTRLDCPERQGELTRVSASADGRACGYVGGDGTEVSLRIVDPQGGLDATLTRLEQELRSYIPAPGAAPAAGSAPIPAPSADAAKAAAKASSEARADAAASVTVRVEGDEDANGSEVVKLHAPGLSIEANEATESADIRILGGMQIQAGEQGVVFRQRRDVRLRGEALSREKRGVRARLVIGGPQVEPTYSYLEYQVGGRKSGPLAVALVRAKEGDVMEHDGGDVEKLVRRNGGV